MFIKQIRLSEKEKERLSKLKAKTGIKNWNVLCRWAFCSSIKEGTIPAKIDLGPESNVEMSWSTFGGEYGEVYELLLKQWCTNNGLGCEAKTLAYYFSLHLDRGIGYLSATNFIRSIDDLLALSFVKE